MSLLQVEHAFLAEPKDQDVQVAYRTVNETRAAFERSLMGTT